MVEGARLESVCGVKLTAGSNPVLSANLRNSLFGYFFKLIEGYLLHRLLL